jgi:hypothetical protein
VPNTAIITPIGLWEFKRMPFGLQNVVQSFQRLTGRLGAGMDFIFIYMDDILVASRDMESHLLHLRQLLEKLREFGLVLNLKKCQFGRQ